MTEERIQTLLEDIKLEGGLEDQEMTEERVNAILEQVRQAERNMSSVSGWQEAEASGAAAVSVGQPDSAGPEEGRLPPVKIEKQNGGHSDTAKEEKETKKKKASKEDSSKVQGGAKASESDSDDETTVTTRVYRRRVILKKPSGETVTEEQFTDEDGNLVTRKVIRKVVRRVYTSEELKEGEADAEAVDVGGGNGGGADDLPAGGADTTLPLEKGERARKRANVLDRETKERRPRKANLRFTVIHCDGKSKLDPPAPGAMSDNTKS
ncbi:hypothetical protein WMY93_010641 [Mugilogobius chulae]|uniref:Uncharacterized protein n=1 Tax=Mugilogobius chulae TaxID=88201 RepID=A0AAW0P7X8_9GOBI